VDAVHEKKVVDIYPWTHIVFTLQKKVKKSFKKSLKLKNEVAPFRVGGYYEPFVPTYYSDPR
jgi:hypothetical protein